MLSFHVMFVQTDRRTDRQTAVKQHAPDLSIRWHKNALSTSILKVLHGNTKSPTGCMYSWRYNILYLTHYQTTNFRLFHTERVTEDNFKFDESGRELSKWVENTVGKGEIARYEQFLFFPQCFQKACFLGASKGVIVWE